MVSGACVGWQYGPDGSLQGQFHGVDLAPGQTFSFVLGRCVPPSGGYKPGLVGVTVDLQLFESSAARPMVGRSLEIVRWLVSDAAPLITCADVLEQVTEERAQCNADLAATNILLSNTQSELAACQAKPEWHDQDGDGEEDRTDACTGTPLGKAVDQAGCSLSQVCIAVDASTRVGQKRCKAIDWKNDELLVSPLDCIVVKQNGVSLCVAAP